MFIIEVSKLRSTTNQDNNILATGMLIDRKLFNR